MDDNKKYYKIVLSYAMKYKSKLLVMYMHLLYELGIGKLLPLLFGIIVDQLVYYKDKEVFLHILWVYIVLDLSYIVNFVLYQVLWQKLYDSYVKDIKIRIINHAFCLKAKYFSDMEPGDIVTLITDDALNFYHIIQRNLYRVINSGISIVITLVLMFLINWELAAVICIVVPLTLLVTRYFERKIRTTAIEQREIYNTYISQLFEFIDGLKRMSIFDWKGLFLNKIIQKNKCICEYDMHNKKREEVCSILIELIKLFCELLIYGISLVLIIRDTLTVGEFIVFIEYYSSVKNSINDIVGRNLDFQQRKASVERIHLLLNEEVEVEEQCDELQVTCGNIEIRDIEFSYKPEEKIFDNLSCRINPKENIAIIGKNGAGKSTLAFLIMKFYELQKGDILIGGQSLCKCTLKSIRENIGLCQQDVTIFNGTIKENILIAKLDASEDEIMEACRKACIEKRIKELSLGLDTLIGDGGVSLSGGERQRIALARLFLKNPNIIIWDEALSALDSNTKAQINESIVNLRKERTNIIISHDIDEVLSCDKFWLLEDKRLHEVDKDFCIKFLLDA